jgi:hypothetical protein
MTKAWKLLLGFAGCLFIYMLWCGVTLQEIAFTFAIVGLPILISLVMG